jgi:hypothetical protein
VVVFAISRTFLLFAAINYPGISDVENSYRGWAEEVLVEGDQLYEEIAIEYPPAALPFLIGPGIIDTAERGYRIGFVSLMFLVDVIGFVAVILLARRRKSMLGPWIWVAAIAILGPLAYLRFDLVPAVATMWAIARMDVDDWLGAGGALGFAIATKAYAVVLIPVMFVVCPAEQRKRFLLGMGAFVFLPLLPFVASLDTVVERVLGYHSQRGIQIESLWGSILFIVRSSERLIHIAHNYGAHHFEGGFVPLIKLAASVLTLGVTALGTWIASRLPRAPEGVAAAAFTTLVLVVAVASVFSPQFMIWVVALAAVAAAYRGSRVSLQALAVVFITALTRWIYPTLHAGLVHADNLPIIVLWARNLALLLTGIYAAVRLIESVSGPSTPADASEGKQ